MRKGMFAAVCVAVFTAVLLVPLGLQGAFAPSEVAEVASPAAGATLEAAGAELDEVEVGDAPDAEPRAIAKSDSGMEYEQGVMLVGLQDDATAEQLNARLAALDYIATKQVADDDITLGYVALDLAAGVGMDEAESRIADEPLVKAAQPNYVYHQLESESQASSLSAGTLAETETQSEVTVNDEFAEDQWALEAVHAYEAWDKVKVQKAVTVAVLDDGFKTTHEDLKSNVVATYNAVSGGTNVAPKYGEHGTHVAGIVAASADNGKGVAGVSYNAGLLPIQVFTQSGASTQSLLKAYDYVVKNAGNYNIKVVNMSLGITLPGWTLDTVNADKIYDHALTDSVEAANKKGILTVCAAGNDVGQKVNMGTWDEPYVVTLKAYANYPSDWLDNSLGVIALKEVKGKLPARASYSNYNMTKQKTKNISAPGSDILSTVHDTNSSYDVLDGTSMASPCVAGIAALVFAANPDLSANEVKNIICGTAQDLNPSKNISSKSTFDYETGYGVIDANAAVKKALGGRTSLSGSAVELEEESTYVYDGAAKTPAVASVSLNGKTLVQGVDYKVTYSNNKNAGKARVLVTGIGSYAGAVVKQFTIKPMPVSPTFGLKAKYCVWTGKTVAPETIVKVGSTVLKKGTDYTVAGGKTVGKSTATIKCKGNYSFESKAFSYKIVPKGTSISKLTPAGKGFNVTWKRQAAKMSSSAITGYQVQFSLNKKFASGNKTITVKGYKNITKAIGKLKAKKSYYVRVRTYKTVGKVNYYSPWAAAKKPVVTQA